VRCARTDKGVHAAGNIISLKLQDEEEDIVRKINDHLSPQIRVWGIQRTVNSFSCYQACDSRWYEYLIPSHAFLPPHPSTFLGRRLPEIAAECGDLDGYKARQAEVASFWDDVEEEYIAPILAELNEPVKTLVKQALLDVEESADMADGDKGSPAATTTQSQDEKIPAAGTEERKELDAAVRRLRKAYATAKKAHRIAPARLERIDAVLQLFLGTRNFHNYTIQKTFSDPSAKRVIRSFRLNHTPIVAHGTEWLSLKIHGQSFMMHQIRKMVGMIALLVRSGCPPERVAESFTAAPLSIPKVPGLGLLLERPVFDSYNAGAATRFARDTIDFVRYEEEMLSFKQREIYERIFREEEDSSAFGIFFNHVDHLKEIQLLYLSSKGLKASEGWKGYADKRPAAVESDDEVVDGKEEG